MTDDSREVSGRQKDMPDKVIDGETISNSGPGRCSTGSRLQSAYQRLPVLCPYRVWPKYRLGR